MKRTNKTFWLIPVIAGLVIAKRIITKKRHGLYLGNKGGTATKAPRGTGEIENAITKYQIDDV